MVDPKVRKRNTEIRKITPSPCDSERPRHEVTYRHMHVYLGCYAGDAGQSAEPLRAVPCAPRAAPVAMPWD